MAVLLLTGLSVAACGGGRAKEVETVPQPARQNRTVESSGYSEADVRFMADMIGHHAQALVMAGWAPTHGASPAIRRLAERIVNGQQDEIATMQHWLRDRELPVPEGSHMGHGHLMPGMLTDAQMRQLEEAKGPEFDRLFLTFMIQHHRGAVAMVKELFGTPGAAQDETVFKFASDANVDQSTEIARMERMLSALPAGEPSS
jgi:uncharacterized protein (DUF305 family)